VKHPYTTANIAQLFMDNIVRLHGLPNSLVSDRDTIFLSKFWQQLFEVYKIDLKLSTAYHPQTDGQTERVNQCLEMYLRCAVQEAPATWKSWLSLAELWYNTNYHSSLGCSPFKALYGCEANLGALPTIPADTSVDVTELVENREAHLQALKEHLARAQNKMKQMADRLRTDLQFQVGDQVLLKLQPYTQSTVASRPYPKLSHKYYGPYSISEKISPVAYKLHLPDGVQIHPVFHISQLKPYTPDHTLVYEHLPTISDLEAAKAVPASILDRRLVKKGNTAVLQVKVAWTNLPATSTT
jgi:hypothetical protein